MRDTLTPFLSQAESPSTGRLRRSVFVGLFAALVTLALVVPPAAVGDGAAADGWPWEVQPGEDSDTFPLVGELTFHGDDGEVPEGRPPFVGVDPGLHRAVFLGDQRLRVVDTRTLEHLDIIDLPISVGKEARERAVFDLERHRVFLPASVTSPAPGQEEAVDYCTSWGVVVCNAAAGVQPAILTVSLTGEHPPVVTPLELELAPEESALQTRIATKLAYHVPTDRLYAVTESSPDVDVTSNVDSYSTLHEFRADDLVSAGKDGDSVEAVWSYRLQTCESADLRYGGFLARSTRGDFMYLACQGPAVTPEVPHGMHGAVRIDLASDPSQFEERFHPFAANLRNGGATGDAANDLLIFVGNAADANRVFTFDAYREAWTGASAMPETGDVRRPMVNSQTGRIYAMTGGAAGYAGIRVTEGDRVEVPNGSDYDAGILELAPGVPGFDPSTRRLFLIGARMCHEWTEAWESGEWQLRSDDGSRCATPEDANPPPHYRVFEDTLPDAPPPEPADYDENTEDVDGTDGPVFTSAGTNATAFGARYLFAGGLATTRVRKPAVGTDFLDPVANLAPVGPSARDVVRSEVEQASLSRVTNTPNVVASATGLSFGEQTGSDIKGNTDQDWPEDFPEEMRGYEAYCDDFGTSPSDDAKTGAAVSCDASQSTGQAGALYTATDEQAPVQVGYAETSVEVREDEKLGAVATVTATARDIDLFGQISIGEIRTEATAVAHGRPGTAATELTREYRQVRVGDSFACGWGKDDQCDAWEVARAITAETQPRLVASVPAQDTTLNPNASDEPDDQPGEARVSNATPGGARAIVTLDKYDARSNEVINQDKRTELPGLQIVYYDDHNRVSRHIFQFAAVELDTFFYISSAPTFDPPDWANGDGGFGDGSGPGGGLPGGLGGAAARTVTPPPVMALGEQPVAPADEPDVNSSVPTGDADEFEADDGASGLEQGQAPSLGTAQGPAVDTGQDAPAPEVAPDASSGEQAVVAQGEQGGSSGPGGLVLTRQRMGQTVPLAVLWVLAALPFYLAVRRRRLLTSSTR